MEVLTCNIQQWCDTSLTSCVERETSLSVNKASHHVFEMWWSCLSPSVLQLWAAAQQTTPVTHPACRCVWIERVEDRATGAREASMEEALATGLAHCLNHKVRNDHRMLTVVSVWFICGGRQRARAVSHRPLLCFHTEINQAWNLRRKPEFKNMLNSDVQYTDYTV